MKKNRKSKQYFHKTCRDVQIGRLYHKYNYISIYLLFNKLSDVYHNVIVTKHTETSKLGISTFCGEYIVIELCRDAQIGRLYR
jgi:hypothetical protein